MPRSIELLLCSLPGRRALEFAERITKRLLTRANHDTLSRVNKVEPIKSVLLAVGSVEERHTATEFDPLAKVEPDAARRLLQSALQKFAAVGYHATTTREISLGAGMSPAALYVHYPSKEAMLFQLSLLGHESVLHAMQESAKKQRNPSGRVRSVVKALTVWHCLHISLGRVAQYELDALTEEHHAVISAIRRAIQQSMEAEIELGVVTGEFDVSSAHDASRAIMALGVDVVRWYRANRRLTPESLASNYAELALRMLRP